MHGATTMFFQPILLGLTLAACAGIRVFMPFFFVGAMGRYAHAPVPDMLSWAASDAGFLLLGIATLVEVLADKIPVIDHALDSLQSFIKPAAGLILPVALLQDASPMTAWVLGIAAGAPFALGIHATKAGTRVASTATTAGAGNPLLSLLEDVMAIALLVFAAIAPLLAALLVVVLAIVVVKALKRMKRLVNREQTNKARKAFQDRSTRGQSPTPPPAPTD